MAVSVKPAEGVRSLHHSPFSGLAFFSRGFSTHGGMGRATPAAAKVSFFSLYTEKREMRREFALK
jgi:hypothetical protein